MNTQQRQLLRVATAIAQRYATASQSQAAIDLPADLWSQCNASLRRIEKARRRGWLEAAARQRGALMNQLVDLRERVAQSVASIQGMTAQRRSVSAADIYQDLQSLHDEFETVSFNRHENTLSAHTEPLRLEGVFLGPFEIRLDWKSLPDEPRYDIIATDPHPASCNEDVTHPHVSSGQLCEGDGKSAICRALEDGRLADFFLIVANLLRTYNSGSPHVSLDDWEGVRCTDCDTLVAGDDRYSCDKCSASLCSDCSRGCEKCSDYFCYSCTGECVRCGCSVCLYCLTRCDKCEKIYCESCLHQNQGNKCNTCREQEKEEQDDFEATTETVPVHAHTSI